MSRISSDIPKVKDFTSFAANKGTALVIGSLSLVAALAWNSAFQSYFQSKEELRKRGPWFYAFSVTIVAIILIYFFAKIENTYISGGTLN